MHTKAAVAEEDPVRDGSEARVPLSAVRALLVGRNLLGRMLRVNVFACDVLSGRGRKGENLLEKVRGKGAGRRGRKKFHCFVLPSASCSGAPFPPTAGTTDETRKETMKREARS